MNESGQSLYLERLTALIQLYLELELSLLDAILAAESDLVTMKKMGFSSRSNSRHRLAAFSPSFGESRRAFQYEQRRNRE